MSKRKVDEAFHQAGYKDYEIVYPFCYKTKNGINFFRYLEDGRYEFICMDKYATTMSFGSRAGTIEALLEEKDFYFKVIANLNEVISNEDFEFQRALYLSEYNKYLLGDKYLAGEVDRLLKSKPKIVEQIEGDIITSNDEEPPF